VSMELGHFRQNYQRAALEREHLADDPIKQFELWFQAATQAAIPEPNAMVLATVAPKGYPAQRTVLLKYFDQSGFVFFTNYESRKAQHLAVNPMASLHFLWIPLEQQIEIQGKVEQISKAETLTYFLSRPRGSQIGAWCSHQSQVITSRKLLELKFDEMTRKFADGQIPLPSFWGGYRLVPEQFEFWQGRPNRLHDRFSYSRQPEGGWQIQRLSP
jgi:pyridoxamine 5'-phosphate oxidase